MSAEYNGRLDADKTVPIWPRPLVRTQHRIRAENLTSDPNGSLPTDDGCYWEGTDWRVRDRLAGQINARMALEDAIDAAWY